MKKLSFSLFNIFAPVSIVILIILIVVPFKLINLEQAQRIATWQKVYNELKYSFELVNLHEGNIIPADEKDLNEIWYKIIPYLNLKSPEKINLKRYSYRKMNGSSVKKNWQFYFTDFYETKSGILISFKENQSEIISDKQPLYFLFVDINGKNKPNRIGQDIFFLSVYANHITALGEGRTHARLKANCSPIGSGLYCSEYYLLGGSF